MADVPLIPNRVARRAVMQLSGLGRQPANSGKGDDLLALFRDLGFVQIDSISTVERAHHMILHARAPSYRPKHLTRLLEQDRSLFEHWTHDASIIPIEFFPYWNLRFERSALRLDERWDKDRRIGFREKIPSILDQIQSTGPVCSKTVGEGERRGSGGWWDWHPSKTALEYLWHSGRISVTRRESFRKIYDLTETVIPDEHRQFRPSPAETIDWACRSALDRLGMATSGEIAAFWDLISAAEARSWCQDNLHSGMLREVDVVGADRAPRRAFTFAEGLNTLLECPEPPGSVRILSPFDPLIRDRARLERLFAFDYRIEIYVPAAKRKYGYYVFPVLERDNLIGRIDIQCDRKADVLNVTAFWPEKGVRLTSARLSRLETAIERTRRFAGVDSTQFANGWLRT